ncbi:hypothetical protein ACOSQ2_016793 [Xanthoceras sorbifolium]
MIFILEIQIQSTGLLSASSQQKQNLSTNIDLLKQNLKNNIYARTHKKKKKKKKKRKKRKKYIYKQLLDMRGKEIQPLLNHNLYNKNKNKQNRKNNNKQNETR